MNKRVDHYEMVINMNEARIQTIEQIKDFLCGSKDVIFLPEGNDDERYGHISKVLFRFDYPRQPKKNRGILRRYLERTTGYSRAQLTRLIKRWHGNRLSAKPLVKRYSAPALPFARKYTQEDVTLLVEMDRANPGVCGPAIAHLLRRAYEVYDDARYVRLAELSVSHLYNLRQSSGYQNQRTTFIETRAVCNAIGVRKAPAPEGRVGFVRIDTVHQGDFDGRKGVYHITCVDIVSQWQVEACVARISETFLLPVLKQIIAQFPFVIHGFHSDNGSEYINHQVASLLEKLRIEQTKSRSRHSNDNALAESKNNSVVRKHFGYEHIPQIHADDINLFYRETFNPWLNMHRPCLFATDAVSAKGKIVKQYKHKNVKTPLECLVQAERDGKVTLKPEESIAAWIARAAEQTDLAASIAMQAAKNALLERCRRQRKRA